MKVNIMKYLLIGIFILSSMNTVYDPTSMEKEENSNLHTEIIWTTHNNKQTTLTKKELNQVTQQQQSVSNEELATPESLEEAIDLSQYPSVSVVATGYTAGVESTGKTPDHPQYGITYSGLEVRRDLYSTIAADLNKFPIGTILYVPGYGFGVVADIGGAINGNKIDLYYETVEDVYKEWGKKTVDVYVIEKGNGKLTEERLDALNETEALQVFRQQILTKI